jgi:hypothetical protein
MVFGDDATRNGYQSELMQKVRDTIEEDRAARRNRPATRDTPAVIIGAMGLGGGISESVK